MKPEPWRILLVDDDEEDFFITKSLLGLAKSRSITLDWSPTYEAGQASLAANHYHAVLVDYDLGMKTGIEFIQEAAGAGYPAPLILYTGRGSYEVDVEAMSAGAALYLTKGEVNPLLLERGIRYAIERKQAEQALRESTEKFSQLFNAMLDGFALHEMILDPAGKPVDYRFLEVNPSFEKLTGLRAVDVLNKTVLEVMPDTEEFWIKTYGEVALSGKSVRFENYSHVLGKYFEVVAFSPRPGQFAVVFTDVTKRKLAEKALHAAKEELELRVQERTAELHRANDALEKIFSNIHLLVAFLDRDFNFIRVNEKYARADGRDPDFFIGKNHFDLYPHPENEAIFRRVVETGEPYFTSAKPFEYPEQPEREISYWDWSLQPIIAEDGQVNELLLSLLDVTERQLADNKQREFAEQAQGLAEMLELMFQSTPAATFLINERGKITRTNRQAEIIFGYDQEELCGENIDRLVPERYRARHVLHREAYISNPDIRSMGGRRHYVACRKNGEEFPIEISLSPVHFGSEFNVICVIHDLNLGN